MKNFKFGVYQHFKGNKYKVLNIGRDSDSLEEVVIYQGLYGDNPVFVRPLKEFTETIERNGEKIERFKYIMKRRVMTLCLVHKGDEVLLGMKKIGFGKGNWNGFGGKVKEGESVEDAAMRELKEECGLVAENISKGGINEFEFIEDNELHEVHIFHASEFTGEPIESDEMIPKWFKKSEIPFDEMWPDDKEWIPLLLEGKKFKGRFSFNKLNEITDSELKEVDEV